MEKDFAKQRTIEDISIEDVRIQVTAFVKEVLSENYITLDDKTGQIKVDLKDIDFKYKEGDLINIFGELKVPVDGKKEIEAEIIQDMRDLNFEYYQKVYEIMKTL